MSNLHSTFVPKSFLNDPEVGTLDVMVVRRRGADRFDVGMFLVDPFCLGVKRSYFRSLDSKELEELKEEVFEGDLEERPGAWGRKFIEGAVDYARNLGFAPSPEYKKGARVFGGLKAADCDETFTYGKDGKPFYIQGPHEDEETARRIVRRLYAGCGEGNYDFTVVAPDLDGETDEELDEENHGFDKEPAEAMLFAAQTGGGEPSPRFQKALDVYKKAGENVCPDEIDYDPEQTDFAEAVQSLLEDLYEFFDDNDLFAPLPDDTPLTEEEYIDSKRAFVCALVVKLLYVHSRPKKKAARMEAIKRVAENDEETLLLSSLTKMQGSANRLSAILYFYRDEENRPLHIWWSSKALDRLGKPRVEIFGFRTLF